MKNIVSIGFLLNRLLFLFFGTCLFFVDSAAQHAYSLRQIGYPQGLSNSAVLSIYQDKDGFMWFGTYDGLNHFDGKTMHVYRTDMAMEKRLLNNVIYQVNGAGGDRLWVSTNTGVSLFSVNQRSVVDTYEIFRDGFTLFSNRQGDTWVLDSKSIFHFDRVQHRFIPIEENVAGYDSNLSFVDDQGHLWLFSSTDNSVYKCLMSSGGKESEWVKIRTNIHQKQIIYTFHQHGILSFIDQDHDLFLFDLLRNSKVYIRNVKDLLHKYGDVKGIISFYEDIVIAFMQNGLVKLDAASHYSESIIDNSIRVFSMYKDPVQDLIWVGTDGQGVMAFSQKHSIAHHLMFSDLQNKIIRQVRSIYADKRGNLWFGTKGDGLVRVKDYEQWNTREPSLSAVSVYYPHFQKKLSEYVRELNEYQVFGLVPSRYYDLFWIGSSGNPGLSYYDYLQDRIIPVEGPAGALRKVHRVYEENDSTLWMTTSGDGLYKAFIRHKNGILVADSVRQFIFWDGGKEINDFFPMCVENDSIMWLGSRGMGLVKFNYKNEKYQVFLLGDKDHFSINDILSIYRKEDAFFLGTVSGLVRLQFSSDGEPTIFCMGKEQGFLNDMIHGILEDGNGFLWLSTNKGLVKYNPLNHTFHTYYYSKGLQIGEFSDDAFYQCPYTGNLFFGGIDGLLCLEHERMNVREYHPEVRFRDLTLGMEPVNFYDYYNPERNLLELQGASLSLTISFVAPDFVEGDNFEYSYKLEGGKQDTWTLFSPDNVASFKSIPYGDYVLKVRYKKDVFDTEYQEYALGIHIMPPWYLSLGAYVVYGLILLAFIVYGCHLANNYFRREQLIKELMQHETHNATMSSLGGQFHRTSGLFATIYRMCGQLQQFQSMPKAYYDILDVIHETVISFAFQAEEIKDVSLDWATFLPQKPVIYGEVNIRQLSDEIIQTLQYRYPDIAVDSPVEVPEEIGLYLPKNALRYILYYLYVTIGHSHEPLSVSMSLETDQFRIRFALSESLASRFLNLLDRKETDGVVGDFETTLYQGLFVYGMEAMKGKAIQDEQGLLIEIPLEDRKVENLSDDEHRKTVLLLEDKLEIAWLVQDVLAADYKVEVVGTAKEAFRYLRTHTVHVFLADTLIYLKKEYKFMEYVQAHKGLLMNVAFIPLLTWKAAAVLYKDLGNLVDGFVVMPYNILFLKEIVSLAMHHRASLKEEVVCVEASVEPKHEMHFENQEQAEFAKQLWQVLDDHLDNEDLNTAFIAEQMNISPRQFYRRFKDVSSLSPADYVKNYRIQKAASLLQETDWPVLRIISEVGIQSRSYFYKEFVSRYGVTPKQYRKNFLQTGRSDS